MEHFLISQISKHGYVAIFALMAIGSACIPIPSEAVMLFGGSLTAGAVVAGVSVHLSLLGVVLAGMVGNLVGSLIAYGVGRTGGRAIAERWGKYVLIRHHDLDKAEHFFARHGDAAVLIGRIIPVVRTFISFPAGIAEMPPVKFSILTFLGSLPWTLGLAIAGRLLATHWQSVAKVGTPVSVVVGLVLVGIIVRWYMLRRKQLLQ